MRNLLNIKVDDSYAEDLFAIDQNESLSSEKFKGVLDDTTESSSLQDGN